MNKETEELTISNEGKYEDSNNKKTPNGLNVSVNTCKSGLGEEKVADSTFFLFTGFLILVLQLPNIWADFLFFRFTLTVIDLLNVPVGRIILHDLHVRSVVFSVVPLGILISVWWKFPESFSH